MELTLQHVVALVFVTVAAGTDLATHRIPNWLNYSGAVVGLAIWGVTAGWDGLANSGMGFFTGFIPLLILYTGGGLGAGDVKMMGAVGALLGFPAALNALLASILVGGFFAAVILLWQGRLYGILKHLVSRLWGLVYLPHVPEPLPEHKDSFVFGVAIAGGTYLTVASILTAVDTPGKLFG